MATIEQKDQKQIQVYFWCKFFLSSHILQTRVFEMDLFHEGQYAIFGRGENNMLMKSSLAFNAVGYFLIMATYRNISSLLNHVIIIMLWKTSFYIFLTTLKMNRG